MSSSPAPVASALALAGSAPSRFLPLRRDGPDGDLRRRAPARGSARRGRCPRPGRSSSAPRSRSVGRASLASGRSWARNGRSAFATGLESRDQRVEVVQRRAQVDEGRVRAAHEARQPADRLAQRRLLVPEGVRGRLQVVDQGREVRLALGEVGDELRGGDDEVLEQAVVAVELAEEAARRRQRRVEVQQALAVRVAVAAVLARRAADDVAQRRTRRRIERVEELVEIDRRGGGRLRDRRAVRQVGRRVRRRAAGPGSGWRRPTATPGAR